MLNEKKKFMKIVFSMIFFIIFIIFLTSCTNLNSRENTGSIRLKLVFPNESSRVIPSNTDGYIVRISGNDFTWHSENYDFSDQNGNSEFTISSIPAGEVLVDVMAYKEKSLLPFIISNKEILAANSVICQIIPGETVSNLNITLLETQKIIIPPTHKERNMIGAVSMKKDDGNKAILTLMGVEGFDNIFENPDDFTFVLYESDSRTNKDYKRPCEITSEEAGNKLLDLCFVIDTSGSMGDKIQGVKNSISSFVDNLTTNENFNVNLAAVGYADNNYRKFEFSDDVDQFKNTVGNFPATGGDERAHTAINEALKFSWKENAQKIIVLITDEDSDDNPTVQNEVLEKLSRRNTTVYLLYDQYDCTNLLPLVDSTGGEKQILPESGTFDLTELGITNFIQRNINIEYPVGTKNILHKLKLVISNEEWFFDLNNSKIPFEAYY